MLLNVLHKIINIFVFMAVVGAIILTILLNSYAQSKPLLANKIASIPIPFSLIVPKKEAPELIKVSDMNFNNSIFSQADKNKLLDFMPELTKEVKKDNGFDEKRPYFNSQKLSQRDKTTIAKYSNDLFKERFQSLNNINLYSLGADKTGKFIIINVIMQNDSPLYTNSLIKIHVNNKLRFNDFIFLKNIKQKMILPPMFRSNEFDNTYLSKGQSKVSELFSKIDLSNVYDDVKDQKIDNSQKFINLTQGYKDKKSIDSIRKIILNSDGMFTNYAINEYSYTDYPSIIKIYVNVGSYTKINKYVFNYDYISQNIISINSLN